MDEDTPDDRVHTLLVQARCSPATRSAGRRPATRATVAAIDAERHPGLLRALVPPRRPRGGGRRRARSRRRSWPRSTQHFAAPAGGELPERVAARRRRRPLASCSGGAPSRPTWPSGVAGCAPRRRRPWRRSTWSTTCSAAACRAGCSTRSASSGGWPTRCSRRRRRTATPARSTIYAGTAPSPGRRGARRSSTASSSGLADERHRRPTSWRWPRATSRARSCSAWRTRPAA